MIVRLLGVIVERLSYRVIVAVMMLVIFRVMPVTVRVRVCLLTMTVEYRTHAACAYNYTDQQQHQNRPSEHAHQVLG